ncbi:porin family protein [Flavobacteriaceae bacterium XHP0103]|uniref:outer membrane beta-barrel protein n=1 Tax=Marixanthotalea marina TaxID=2844359 RepID=UPI002989AA46|nr:outer membrane beta-barrel protein [Marixanthotalea marina]MBU3822001.1 porin family protein [Marixanthotalea marina]
MRTNLKYNLLLGLLLFVTSFQMMAQRQTEKWKGQISVGVNNPLENSQSAGYYSKYINFPSVNLGVQHMFSEQLGAKLDLGFNRSTSNSDSPEFKLNYTRVNVQAVYSLANLLRFMPERILVVAHAGPGFSFSKPLGNFSDNKYTYLNALGGLEFHYGMSENISLYTDVGYVLALSGKDKYNPIVDGFSFNGDLIYISFGISFSLSGCQYC